MLAAADAENPEASRFWEAFEDEREGKTLYETIPQPRSQRMSDSQHELQKQISHVRQDKKLGNLNNAASINSKTHLTLQSVLVALQLLFLTARLRWASHKYFQLLLLDLDNQQCAAKSSSILFVLNR